MLGIDLGTTYTSAAVVADGRAEVVQLGLRSSVVPTVVFLTEDGQQLTGETANRRAVTAPARVAREFKRRVGDTAPLLLGGTPMAPQALMATMLRWVLDHVTAERGEPPAHVAVSHPANWGPYKLGLLEQAVRLADLESATMITEPEAAARYYASTQRLSPGEIVVVYDLGGGTFDTAVLEATQGGFEILGTPEGIEHLGGVDIDEAVFGLVATALGGALDGLDPDDPLVTAGAARLRRDCVEAKEALSSDTEAVVPVMLPTVQTEVRITREQLDALVRPTLAATIGALERALRSAQVTPDQLAAVLLVGGASRMPVVAEMVGEALGRRVAVDTHPKHAVSLGAALEAEAGLAREHGAGPVVAEIVPPRDTPPPPGGSVPPVASVAAGGEPRRPSRPTMRSGAPPPPAPPPPAVPSGGDGVGQDDGGGGAARRDWRRLLYIGVPLVAIVIAAVILVAVRGGGGDGDDDGGSGDAADAQPPVDQASDTTETDASTASNPATTPVTNPTAATTGPVVETTEPATVPLVAATQPTATTAPSVPSGPSAAIAGLGVGRLIPVTAFPDGVEVDAGGRIWTATSFGERATRIDPVTGQQDSITFPTGSSPLAVLASPEVVYVTLSGSDQIARINPETLEYDLLEVHDRPAFLAWGADSLWSVSDAGWLERIDPATFTVTSSVEIPGAKGVAIVGDTAWVTASTTGDLVRVDIPSNEVVGSFPVGTGPDAIVADGAALWVTNRGEGTVVRFDTIYQQVTSRVTTGTAPAAIALDGDRLWVTDATDGTLVLVDRVTAAVAQSTVVGRRPLGLQPLGDRVWVSAADDDMVAEVRVWTEPPTEPRVQISSIEIVGTRYVPTFTTQNFTPALGGDAHVHLYWNTSLVADVGVPGSSPWRVWDLPERVDDAFFDFANKPAGANAICILVAAPAHQIADVDGDGAPDYDTGNCVRLPDPT